MLAQSVGNVYEDQHPLCRKFGQEPPKDAHQQSTHYYNDSRSENEVPCCGGGARFDDKTDSKDNGKVNKKDGDESLGYSEDPKHLSKGGVSSWSSVVFHLSNSEEQLSQFRPSQ